jgi:hypothetical protein
VRGSNFPPAQHNQLNGRCSLQLHANTACCVI